MSDELLALTVVRSFRLTIADLDCLQSLAREHDMGEAQCLRVIIRRAAFGLAPLPLAPAEQARLRRCSAGLPIGPAVAPTVSECCPAVPDTLVVTLSDGNS